MRNVITYEKLLHYFSITGRALSLAKDNFDLVREKEAADFYDMASRYYSDAHYFEQKNDLVNAFAALSYAHGWLDAGARLGLFKVRDSSLFTIDEKTITTI